MPTLTDLEGLSDHLWYSSF